MKTIRITTSLNLIILLKKSIYGLKVCVLFLILLIRFVIIPFQTPSSSEILFVVNLLLINCLLIIYKLALTYLFVIYGLNEGDLMAVPKYDIDSLVDLIKSADERKASGAFSQLFDELRRSLVYYTYALTQNLPEAEDIVSVSFSKLWLLRQNFDSVNSMKSFLYVTCRNAAYDYLKFIQNTKRNIEISVGNIEEHSERLQDEDAQQFEMMRAAILHEIYKEIEVLTPQLKNITKLAFVEGKTARQIARALNLSEQTVRNSMTVARKVLRTRLLIKKLFLLLATLSPSFTL